MGNNSVLLLKSLVEGSRQQTLERLTDPEHETFWVAEQYLRPTGVSTDELLAGIVDGEKDCGIDALYVFANSICISDDTPLQALGKRAALDLVLLQVKNAAGFTEAAIDKLIVNTPRLFDFDRDENLLSQFANSKLIEVTRRFLKTFRDLPMPDLTVYVVFASLKATQIHPNIRLKGEELQRTCTRVLGNCPVQVVFLDASELYDLARESRSVVKELQLAENPISTDIPGGYVGVVRLRDYERFISQDTGELDATLFEANVRDYEGDTSVNVSIQETLMADERDVDFWWLNNGVTVVAKRVTLANKLLQLESPQIVNGLQTSSEIFQRNRTQEGRDDDRSVLVKVIQAEDTKVRDRIIRATNSQTAFGPSTLRATDRVQRQIEDYLGSKGLFYERRRRYYYNQGRPLDRIVSIDVMGQSLLSVVVHLPHVARATPSKVFDRDIYDLAFSPQHPISMYAAAIGILRQCDAYLRSIRSDSADDFRFHLAMLASVFKTRKVKPKATEIASLEDVEIDSSEFGYLYENLQQVFADQARRQNIVLFDQLAKSQRTTAALVDASRIMLARTPRVR